MSRPEHSSLLDRPYDAAALHAFLHELKACRPVRAPGLDLGKLLVGPLIVAGLAEDCFYRIRRLQADLGDLILAEGAASGWIWADLHRALKAAVAEARFRSHEHYDRVTLLREALFLELGAGEPGREAVLAVPDLGDEVTTLRFAAGAHGWPAANLVAVMARLLERASGPVRDARLALLAEWGMARRIAELVAAGVPGETGAGARALEAQLVRALGPAPKGGWPLPDPCRRLAELGPGAGRWFPRKIGVLPDGRRRDGLDYFEPRLPCPGCEAEVTYPAVRLDLAAPPAPALTAGEWRALAAFPVGAIALAFQPRPPVAGPVRDCPGCRGTGREPSGRTCLACAEFECAASDPYELGELLWMLDQAVPEAGRSAPAVAALYRTLHQARDRRLPPAVACRACRTLMPPIHDLELDDELIAGQGLLPREEIPAP